MSTTDRMGSIYPDDHEGVIMDNTLEPLTEAEFSQALLDFEEDYRYLESLIVQSRRTKK